MARDLLLFKLNILAPRDAFDDLLVAAGDMRLPWHKAVERLERETQAAAREFALRRIQEWKADGEGVQVVRQDVPGAGVPQVQSTPEEK